MYVCRTTVCIHTTRVSTTTTLPTATVVIKPDKTATVVITHERKGASKFGAHQVRGSRRWLRRSSAAIAPAPLGRRHRLDSPRPQRQTRNEQGSPGGRGRRGGHRTSQATAPAAGLSIRRRHAQATNQNLGWYCPSGTTVLVLS